MIRTPFEFLNFKNRKNKVAYKSQRLTGYS